jgi:hypothetical protein
MNTELIIQLLPLINSLLSMLNVEQKEKLIKGLQAMNEGEHDAIAELLDDVLAQR